MDWLLTNYLTLLVALMTVIGTASSVAAVLAPLTKSDWDNVLARKLKWVYLTLRKLGLNDLAPPKELPAPEESE
jgi:hypothetical protein